MSTLKEVMEEVKRLQEKTSIVDTLSEYLIENFLTKSGKPPVKLILNPETKAPVSSESIEYILTELQEYSRDLIEDSEELLDTIVEVPKADNATLFKVTSNGTKPN